jgi:hypothetical protein
MASSGALRHSLWHSLVDLFDVADYPEYPEAIKAGILAMIKVATY